MENYAIPLLHLMISIFNDIIDYFTDLFDTQIIQKGDDELMLEDDYKKMDETIQKCRSDVELFNKSSLGEKETNLSQDKKVCGGRAPRPQSRPRTFFSLARSASGVITRLSAKAVTRVMLARGCPASQQPAQASSRSAGEVRLSRVTAASAAPVALRDSAYSRSSEKSGAVTPAARSSQR